jgi:hypothetical protein
VRTSALINAPRARDHPRHARRVLLDGTRAYGVEYARGGVTTNATAEREVLLSGGSFNSPQLPTLSGIGPADHLRETPGTMSFIALTSITPQVTLTPSTTQRRLCSRDGWRSDRDGYTLRRVSFRCGSPRRCRSCGRWRARTS